MIKKNRNWILIGLIIANFIINILAYYNTNNFMVSEARGSYNIYNNIASGVKLPLFYGNHGTLSGYIANFFSSTSMTAYFWFQAFLATLATVLVYGITRKITNNKRAPLISLILATLFMDFHLLTPVFYTQIYEIFFAALVIYLTLLLLEKRKILWQVLTVFLIVAALYISGFFRGTLNYYHYLMLLMALIMLIGRRFREFLLLTMVFALTITVINVFLRSQFRDASRIDDPNFEFFGHTWYGGHGGEGAFIYEENRELYNQRLEEYMQIKNYSQPTPEVHYEFQRSEIRESITKHTGKWVLLQMKKLFFTYGIIPIKDSIVLLTSGKVPISLPLVLLIVQLPFLAVLMSFIFGMVKGFSFADLRNPKILLMILWLGYLIAATSLYGHYQERYRIVVMMTAMIPIAGMYLGPIKHLREFFVMAKIRVLILAAILLTLSAVWGYQSLSVLYKDRSRYENAMKNASITKNPLRMSLDMDYGPPKKYSWFGEMSAYMYYPLNTIMPQETEL